MTVQWNLFGGTVIKLGTERHRHLLPKIDDMSAIGCFGLTELGYGNNAIEMETTAHYVSSLALASPPACHTPIQVAGVGGKQERRPVGD